MNLPSTTTSSPRIHESNLELFRARLIAKLCIAIVCMVQFIPRLPTIVSDSSQFGKAALFSIISLPFGPIVSLIVLIEYLLFKKKGPRILKYSNLIDIVLLFFFMGDWMTSLISALLRIKGSDPACFDMGALYAFTSFSWRTLLVTLIVQRWHIKIIAPVVAVLVTTGFAIAYAPGQLEILLVRMGAQLFNLILIVYCEDKVKWRMIWTNLQQEKWMQVNNFILNNIPENIMILDVKGETRFISESCKSFMRKCHVAMDRSKDFFHKIRDLQQQDVSDPPSPSEGIVAVQMERIQTCNGFLGDTTTNHENTENPLRVEKLGDLIANFKDISAHKHLQERQFLVYNGKLKIEKESHLNQSQDKSIEVKISFVNHFDSFYIILILRDTTQRDLLVTLEETNKYKDQLLASVSHELRAPLNGNINLVETAVNSSKVPDHIKELWLIPALRSSKFLLHLINDILDMSQIKEKKLRLLFQPGNIKETLQSTAQLVELQANKKGIELVLELDSNLPAQFCTDHIRLSQIVLNLLSNAIKFTKEGVVKLRARSINQAKWVKISVEDSGIGMSQENMNKLFSNYTHIEFEGRQIMNPTGVGLGLNIASNLAELLSPKGHHNINVVSIPNQGSIFSLTSYRPKRSILISKIHFFLFFFCFKNKRRNQLFSLRITLAKEKIPLKLDLEDLDNSDETHKVTDERPDITPPFCLSKILRTNTSASLVPLAMGRCESEPLMEGCSCSRILIVDDNPFNTMAFETILSSLEVKCDSVYSGSSSIKKLLSRQGKACGKDCKQYSVIFMDEEMPEMSGTETVKEIRRLQKERLLSSGIKIIGCTAHKSKEQVERFLKAGLDQCIHKPISVGMIKDLLEE